MRKQLTLSILACLLFTTLVSADMNRQTWNSTVAGDGLASLQAFYANNLPGMILDPPPDIVDVIAESWYGDADRAGQPDNYTASLHGWVTIPESGSYTWHLHADDHAILLVSPDVEMANLQEVATIDGWTSVAEWDKYATQTSAPVEYAAGDVLAVFAAFREGGGGDNIGIGWTLPGAGSISYITDFVAAISPLSPVAASASPANGATDLPYYIEELSWSPGFFAESHNVYFSSNFDEVDTGAAAALMAEGLAETSLAIATELETTYFWRVDEVNGAPDFSVFAGKVWSFTVESVGVPVTGVTATASSEFDAGSTAANLVNGSGLTDGLHDTDAANMWLAAAGLPATVDFDLGGTFVLNSMTVWNQNQLIETILGFGAKDVVVETSTDGTTWSIVEGATLINQGTGLPDYAANTTLDMGGATASHVRLTITSGHGFVGQVGLSEVQFSSIPVLPREFSPANGAFLDDPDVTLSWRAGRFTVEHQVLLSQDQAAVADGSAVVATTADKSYALSGLEPGQAYYNQIIDVAADGTTYAGPINFFVTAGSGVTPANVYLEAEAADVLGSSWRVVDDPNASGGVRIGSENGDGNDNGSPAGPEWMASYSFDAPVAGAYNIIFRVMEAGSDSFWVRIVGAEAQSLERPQLAGSGWVRFNGIDAPDGLTWDKVHSNDHGNEVVKFVLPAGPLTLEITKREDGVYLDAILITNDLDVDQSTLPDAIPLTATLTGAAAGTDSSATGSTVFQPNADGTAIGYVLSVTGLENTTMAHIHVSAEPGANGGVVVWLFPAGPPPGLQAGSFTGVLGEGVITADNLAGSLAGQSLDALMLAIQEGRAYVNIHTQQFGGGEIRGQIE